MTASRSHAFAEASVHHPGPKVVTRFLQALPLLISCAALIVSYWSYNASERAARENRERFESERELEASKSKEDVIYLCREVQDRLKSLSRGWTNAYIEADKYDTADRANRDHYVEGLLRESITLCNDLEFGSLLSQTEDLSERLVLLHRAQLRFAQVSGIVDAQSKELATFRETEAAQTTE